MKYSISIILFFIFTSVWVNAQQNANGVTTIGTNAIAESVNDIMAREIIGAYTPRSNEIEKELQYPDRSKLPQNPNSPNATSTSMLKINGSNNQTTAVAPQTIGISFTGANLSGTYSTGSYPPDNMGSVGPTQYIVGVNGRIVSYLKSTGAADGALNTTMDNFFTSVKSTTASTFTSDPHIRYDRLAKRWIFIIIDVPGGAGSLANRVLFGVSADSIITKTSVIKFFYYQYTGKNFVDYPTLGIDRNALYIGGNLFSLSAGSYAGGFALVVQKSSILGSGPIVCKAFTVGTASSGIYTPQGVDNLYDAASTEGYFIGVDAATAGKLDLIRVTNPGTTSPTLSTAVAITVPTFGSPIAIKSKPGTSTTYNLDQDDDRLFAAMIRNGHLWTAHHIGLTNAGAATGTLTRDGARWYDLINFKTGSTPAVNQSGTVYTTNTTNATTDLNYFYPTITINGQGHAAMGFSTAGTNAYANCGFAGRLVNGTSGTLSTPVSITASTTSYNPGDGTPHRWGDYSMTECDPTDDMTFWTIQEFCDASNSYGCRVTSLKAPAPATLKSATPNILGKGASLSLVLKGDTTTGLGFYEPGTSFSKHLAVTIDGGIIVNSVIYNSPSTITLKVTTTNGTSGARTITVTNPDGQTVSSAAIFTYNSAKVSSPTGVETSSNVPTTYNLSQNYPNPFNPSTRISFQVPEAGNVNVSVYDILGNKVTTLVNESKQAGEYEITFDASRLSSGVYFYQMQTDHFTATKKMTVIK